jgi:hypothetical protein
MRCIYQFTYGGRMFFENEVSVMQDDFDNGKAKLIYLIEDRL